MVIKDSRHIKKSNKKEAKINAKKQNDCSRAGDKYAELSKSIDNYTKT